MKLLFVNIFMFILCIPHYGQDKYFVSFLADDGVPGHAFISIGRESEKEKSSITDGTWGMYPKKNNSNVKEILIGEVPGKLKDDFLREVDLTYSCEIKFDDYNKMKGIILKWKSKNYELAKNDCLTFLIEIANVINYKIKVPKREGYKNLPSNYLKKLIELNN